MTNINQERLVEHFIELVKIDSESGNEKTVAEVLAEQLGQIGFKVTKLPIPDTISNGFNIYAILQGELEGAKHFDMSKIESNQAIVLDSGGNIGVVRGGQATNIVMPELYTEAEARSLDDEKLAKQVAHMVSTFEAAAEKHGAEIESTRS